MRCTDELLRGSGLRRRDAQRQCFESVALALRYGNECAVGGDKRVPGVRAG